MNHRMRRVGRPPRQGPLVWVGLALLCALLVVSAELAEAHPLPGMALLLPTAAVLLWYQLRFAD